MEDSCSGVSLEVADAMAALAEARAVETWPSIMSPRSVVVSCAAARALRPERKMREARMLIYGLRLLLFAGIDAKSGDAVEM